MTDILDLSLGAHWGRSWLATIFSDFGKFRLPRGFWIHVWSLMAAARLFYQTCWNLIVYKRLTSPDWRKGLLRGDQSCWIVSKYIIVPKPIRVFLDFKSPLSPISSAQIQSAIQSATVAEQISANQRKSAQISSVQHWIPYFWEIGFQVPNKAELVSKYSDWNKTAGYHQHIFCLPIL